MFPSCFQILLTFPNLQILYLHGNQINDMKEVEKLAKISTLKKLSLHGNPVENEKVSCCLNSIREFTPRGHTKGLELVDFGSCALDISECRWQSQNVNISANRVDPVRR